MTSAEQQALKDVRGYAGAGRIQLSGHARTRMRQRGASIHDVCAALARATACVDQRADPNRAGDWKVTGPDEDGEELSCAVVIDAGVVVVTLF